MRWKGIEREGTMPDMNVSSTSTTRTMPETESSQEAGAARNLLKRTPNNYLFNQVYGLWFYISSFLFTIIITRNLGPGQYGVYSIVQTAMNTLLYVLALGLEDAVATFVPRTIAERGDAAASQLTRYLLTIRLAVLVVSAVIMLFGLPAAAALIGLIPTASAHSLAAGMNNEVLHRYSIPITLYILGSGISNLLGALCSAQMRSHIVLVVGGISQLLLLALGFVLLNLGWGVTGILWLQAGVALFYAAAFIVWQAPFLRVTLKSYRPSVPAIMKLSLSAWVTNIASGALLKQASIILLGIYAVSVVQIGYFNLSFQLADAANTLLVSGFLGVGGAALSAAFAGDNYDRLGKTWQVLIKIETLIEAPALVFCLFNANNIAFALYGTKFIGVGPLLAIFLLFNLLVRLLGATIHQYGLYVTGKARFVVLSQWIGIAVIFAVGALLVPIWGAAGALVADGVAKTVTGILLLIFILPGLPLQYAKDVLVFTLRILLALIVAALPWLIWHPESRLMLGVSGVVFIVLCVGMLLIIKPLSKKDIEMLDSLNSRATAIARYFARA
ncbi:lipopolysaccharide biosynthesis protein [Ktedonobacteria bacterium brp13]|nr:lipopolysaccharide biosynthesis protein [Ktedonobacteria bacterium brp13]